MSTPNDDFPIALIQDRYSGAYSGGPWLAVAEASECVGADLTRVQFCLTSDDGPFGCDVEAGLFWNDRPDWIVAAAPPEEALHALTERFELALKAPRNLFR